MLTLSNRALLRWNGWGLVLGTGFASAATLPLLLLTDHPGGTLAEFLWKVPAVWFGIFLVVSPVLFTVLIFWRALARRHPSMERHRVLRWIGLLFFAGLIATFTHAVLAIYAATTEPTFDWTYVWFRMVTDSAFFGLLVIAAVGWLVVPRLRVDVVLEDVSVNTRSLSPGSNAPPYYAVRVFIGAAFPRVMWRGEIALDW